MKVKMLKPNWPYMPGEVVNVDDITGKRWLKIKLAVKINGRKTVEADTKRPEVKEELAPVQEATEEAVEEKEVMPFENDLDYNQYTKNQLVEMLWSRGIEHNKRQNKAELVALLEAGDRGE